MGKYFGTDGIRGEANNTLTLETAYKVGRFVGNYYAKNGSGKIIIGKDTRLSSSMFENMLAAAVSSSGSDVYLLGYCSTPSLAYVTMKDKFDIGIMISASHNPYTDNGIKIFGNNGIKLNDEVESLIENYIDNPEGIEYACKDDIGNIFNYEQGKEEYKEWLHDLYPLNLSDIKLIVDLANGSNCVMAKDVLDKTGASVTYLNDEFNGTNINNKCGSTHLEMLMDAVKNGDYDLGFAFDGDADRVLFVDHKGEVIDGDKIMYMLSKYLKENNKLTNNTLVTTVMSNMGLFKALEKVDIMTDITLVGDKNVLDSMLKNDFVIGGEQSGHIIYKNDANFGDGLKTALLVLTALKHWNCNIDDATSELRIYPQLLVNQRVVDKTIVLNDEIINAKIKEISDTLGNDGRILVRPSGTEPLIRVMVEASSDDLCNKYVYEVIDLIKEKGYCA